MKVGGLEVGLGRVYPREEVGRAYPRAELVEVGGRVEVGRV